jgi:hypothetical protein
MHENAEWCRPHDAAFYGTFKSGTPAISVLLPTDKRYHGACGAFLRDAPLLRSAAWLSGRLRQLDPQQPKSIWWHTNATFVGFRVVRPLEEQDNLKGLRSKVIKD